MKHLLDYLFENLLFESENAKELLDDLKNREGLGEYVEDLNKMLKDKDAKDVLLNAFVRYKGDDAINLDGTMTFISVKELHPTQNEIDVDKSIAWPFKDEEKAKANMEQLFEKSDKVSFGFPLITFDGKFILDGHHRWSQAYAFNPESKMQCFDLKQVEGEDIDEQEALKLCQGVLAAKRSIDKKGSIPQEKVEGANIFKMKEEDVKKKIIAYAEKQPKAAEIIQKALKVKDNDGIADVICKNLMDLRKENEEYANKGNERKDMPQTDRGGNEPSKGPKDETAHPQNKKSALYALDKGHVDPKTVKK